MKLKSEKKRTRKTKIIRKEVKKIRKNLDKKFKEKAKKRVKNDYKELIDYIKEPNHIKIFKIIFIFI